MIAKNVPNRSWGFDPDSALRLYNLGPALGCATAVDTSALRRILEFPEGGANEVGRAILETVKLRVARSLVHHAANMTVAREGAK